METANSLIRIARVGLAFCHRRRAAVIIFVKAAHVEIAVLTIVTVRALRDVPMALVH